MHNKNYMRLLMIFLSLIALALLSSCTPSDESPAYPATIDVKMDAETLTVNTTSMFLGSTGVFTVTNIADGVTLETDFDLSIFKDNSIVENGTVTATAETNKVMITVVTNTVIGDYTLKIKAKDSSAIYKGEIDVPFQVVINLFAETLAYTGITGVTYGSVGEQYPTTAMTESGIIYTLFHKSGKNFGIDKVTVDTNGKVTVVAGSPVGTGVYTVRAEKSTYTSQTVDISITVSPFDLSSLTLTDNLDITAIVGVDDESGIFTLGGLPTGSGITEPALTYTIKKGTADADATVSVDSVTKKITVTSPTTSLAGSDYRLEITTTDGNFTGTKVSADFTVTVLYGFVYQDVPSSLKVGTAVDIAATKGGITTGAFAVTTGTLPDGLSINTATGDITGVPIAGNTETTAVIVEFTGTGVDTGKTNIADITFPAVTIPSPGEYVLLTMLVSKLNTTSYQGIEVDSSLTPDKVMTIVGDKTGEWVIDGGEYETNYINMVSGSDVFPPSSAPSSVIEYEMIFKTYETPYSKAIRLYVRYTPNSSEGKNKYEFKLHPYRYYREGYYLTQNPQVTVGWYVQPVSYNMQNIRMGFKF